MPAILPTLEFVFRMHVKMPRRERFGTLATGFRRGFTSASGGTIEGPRLSGSIVPNSGGDYPLFDADDNANFDARYLLQADDGTMIYMQNRGYRHATPEINRRLRDNEAVPMTEYYFRTSPIFEAPVGPHDWLNRTIIIGSADRQGDHSVFEYYAVR